MLGEQGLSITALVKYYEGDKLNVFVIGYPFSLSDFRASQWMGCNRYCIGGGIFIF